MKKYILNGYPVKLCLAYISLFLSSACNTHLSKANMKSEEDRNFLTFIENRTKETCISNKNLSSFIPSAILIGNTGSGKTSLFNMLCNDNRKVGASIYTATKDVACSTIYCGNNKFELVDTPSIGSINDFYKNAYLTYKDLTYQNYNAIFLLIPFRSKFENMITEYRELITPFQEYSDKIIVMVSHFDRFEEGVESYIAQEFQEEGIDTDFIFYSASNK